MYTQLRLFSSEINSCIGFISLGYNMFFAITKLLAFLPFGNIFKGLSGRVLLISLIAGVIAFGVWKWKDNIKAQVAEAFYQQQIEDQLQDVKTEVQRLRNIEEARNAAIQRAIQRNESLILSIQEGRREIAGGKYTPAPATQVLKDTMSRIKSIEEADHKPLPKKEESSGNVVIDTWKKVFGGGDE